MQYPFLMLLCPSFEGSRHLAAAFFLQVVHSLLERVRKMNILRGLYFSFVFGSVEASQPPPIPVVAHCWVGIHLWVGI